MRRIVNLTQHNPTPEQRTKGVENLDERHEEIKELLTFEEIPTKKELEDRSKRLARIAAEEGVYTSAMIGGTPYFMSYLEKALKEVGIQPLYTFSKRETEEVKEGDKVVKKSIFKHIGFVEV